MEIVKNEKEFMGLTQGNLSVRNHSIWLTIVICLSLDWYPREKELEVPPRGEFGHLQAHYWAPKTTFESFINLATKLEADECDD